MSISYAYILGLLSSFHCIGMCGALQCAVNFNNESTHTSLNFLIFHVGRIGLYGLLGVLFGFLGKTFIVSSIQQTISIIAGLSIIAYLFFYKKKSNSTAIYNQYLKFTSQQISNLIASKKLAHKFYLGILNGLLPCGMVYIALTNSFLTKSSTMAGMFMLAFGVGTLPLLTLFSFSMQTVLYKFKYQINKFSKYIIAAMAILFILRGLGLNIPYLSPQINSAQIQNEKMCHGQ